MTSDDTDTSAFKTEERGAAARFGTFGGVFTPCTLTILGVIMFMRAGFVVGEGGLLSALIILAIAKSITTLTTLSLSAVATNTEVRTGGVYYIISRTLGHDFGGAIGLTLFVSQAISIAFYVIGFSEALFGLFPGPTSQMVINLTTSGVILLVFFVTFKGADVAIKAQYPILAVLVLAVLSYLIKGAISFDPGQMRANLTAPDDGASFWVLFAIFFPAATGITAGANMSGDLKDPSKSIPRGTLAAIAFTGAVYLLQLVLTAGYSDSSALRAAPSGAFEELKHMSFFSPLVVAGVFAATLSSALGSFLGAPRILQALGRDGLFKPLEYFGKGSGPADEPRRATVLSLIIALGVVWIGDLNAVAEVISMFFLIAYGMINASAFVEARGGNPSFRPRFKKFGWPAALIGAVGSAIAMVKINESAAIVAIVIAAGIYFWLRRKEAEFGDAKRGFVFARVRDNLLKLEKSPPDPKNWRPMLAVITDDAERDRQMLATASWVEGRRGLLAVIEVTGQPEASMEHRLEVAKEREKRIRTFLDAKGIEAFFDAIVVPHADADLDIVLQAYSLGSLRPNTWMVSVPPPNQPERRKHLAINLRTAAAFQRNLVIYKGARLDGIGKRRIDLWWHGQKNGSLMALLAYLASQHPDWRGCQVRLIRVVSSGGENVEAEQDLANLTTAARLEMDIEVILSQRPVSELIVERSASADLVLLGMAESNVLDFEAYLERNDEMLAKLPPTLLVLSNGEVDLLA